VLAHANIHFGVTVPVKGAPAPREMPHLPDASENRAATSVPVPSPCFISEMNGKQPR
jgi:hypothetical protein